MSFTTIPEVVTEWQCSFHYGVMGESGRTLGRVGDEGVALGVASWMCGGGCGVGGWWSRAGRLGLGLGGLKGKALSSIASGISGPR